MTYHGWDKKYDEWIDVNSYRLSPRLNFPSFELMAQMSNEDARRDPTIVALSNPPDLPGRYAEQLLVP